MYPLAYLFPLLSHVLFSHLISTFALGNVHGLKTPSSTGNLIPSSFPHAFHLSLQSSPIAQNNNSLKIFDAALGTNLFRPSPLCFFVLSIWLFFLLVSIRSPPLPPGAFSWITASFKVKDTELLERVGLDAYMFLRFLRMSA